ncbi:LytR/AlgR family response regulator transcription factor [Tenacibaculum sp. nBUS_03]|uniref:LytR/AlgR family response regulator transcription factor n=1 Tax=Tenacibaculum sp. nBUS_03 TaxID=3395320 RepID=UPI003EB81F12
MINCIIIEDQPPAQRILKKYVSQTINLNLLAVLPDAPKAITLMKTEDIHLIFLDIHLPKMSGIDFLKSISNKPKIILTTAFSEYAIKSYEFNVVDYLLKPISKERFNKSMIKLNSILDQEKKIIQKNTILLKSGHERFRINIDNIIYINSDSDYTEVHTDNKVYLSSDTLKQWLEKLKNNFCQVHKSYIININHLEKISANKIYLSATKIVPIGRAFKKNILNQI